MIQRYKDKLDENFKLGGYHYLNPYIKDVLMEDVKIIEFTSMYPHLMIDLHKNGVLDLSAKSLQTCGVDGTLMRVDYFLKNRSKMKLEDTIQYNTEKIFTNSLYGYLAKNYTISKINRMTHYIHLMYGELLENNENKKLFSNGNILYINTDQIFYVGEIDMMDIDLKYESDYFKYLVIEQMNKYVAASSESEIITRGWGSGIKSRPPLDIIALIKSKIRDKKIECLLD